MLGSRKENQDSPKPIEFEGALVSKNDAPDATESRRSARGAQGPLIALVLTLLAVGAILVLSSPSGDESAGGSGGDDPTPDLDESSVTPPVTEAEVVERVEVPRTINVVDVEVGRIPYPFIADRIDSPGPLAQIISTEAGYVALPAFVRSLAPQLLSSPDGLTWEEFAESRVDDGSAVRPVSWNGLFRNGDEFAVVGPATNDTTALDILVSQDGANWQAPDTIDSLSADGRLVAPVSFVEGMVIGFEVLRSLELAPLPDRVVEIRDSGPCGSFLLRADITLSDCTESSVRASPVNAEPGVVVPDCTRAGDADSRLGFTILKLGPLISPSATSEAAFALGRGLPTPEQLDANRIAVLDVGNPAIELCDGSGTLQGKEPGLVIVDTAQNRVFSYPAPSAIASDLIDRRDNRVIGEVQVFEDRTHVVLSTGGALWLIDTLSGEWSELAGRREDLASQTPLDRQFVSSVDSDRIYEVGTEMVATFELTNVGNGAIEALVTVAPINGETSDALERGTGSIIHADDQAIFYTDGLVTWRLAAPSPIAR